MALSNTEKHRRWLAKLRAKAAAFDAGQAAATPAAPVDPGTCDPLRILQQIAMDERVAAGPRVAACRQLLALQGRIVPEPAPAETPAEGPPMPADRVTARAIELMRRRLN
jgi:hypothetical protein